jgi:LacI family transcriptional regulator
MITIREVAEASGVSISTVSKVLTGNAPHNNAQTCEKVRRVAQQMGYRRNAFASAVSRGKFGSVGLLHSTIEVHSKIPETFRRAVEDWVAARDLLLLECRVDEERLRETRQLPRLLREWAVDGLILFCTHGDWEQWDRQVESRQIPTVWLNNKLPRNSVYPDDVAAGRMAARYFLERGCKRAAYLGVLFSGHYSEADRLDGFHAEMTAHGGSCVALTWTSLEEAREMLTGGLLARHPALTGFFCSGSMEAAMLSVALARFNRRVSEDAHVIAIDSEPVRNRIGLDIDTLVMPYATTITDLALERLERKMKDGGGFDSIAVPPVLTLAGQAPRQ